MNFEYFQRQMTLPDWGVQAQMDLQNKSVAIVGMGGLGSWIALSLGGCGVGKINLIDGDRISISNLHRQPLFGPKEVGQKKIDVALGRLSEQFPHTQWEAIPEFLTAENAASLFNSYDLVIDGSDDYNVRLWIDDACKALGIPWIFAGIFQSEIQVGIFHPREGRSFRHWFGEKEGSEVGSCQIQGVLPPIPAMAAQMQVAIALQILGQGKSPLSYPFIHGNLQSFQFQTIFP
jgi:sulfur-carrier protein adenylyltransferase/sulfurtransferase